MSDDDLGEDLGQLEQADLDLESEGIDGEEKKVEAEE